MQIVRYRSSTDKLVLGVLSNAQLIHNFPDSGIALYNVLQLRLHELKALCDAAVQTEPVLQQHARLLPPIDGNIDVWAAGVTYKRSKEARVEESETADIYSKVYVAERPQLVFIATLQ